MVQNERTEIGWDTAACRHWQARSFGENFSWSSWPSWPRDLERCECGQSVAAKVLETVTYCNHKPKSLKKRTFWVTSGAVFGKLFEPRDFSHQKDQNILPVGCHPVSQAASRGSGHDPPPDSRRSRAGASGAEETARVVFICLLAKDLFLKAFPRVDLKHFGYFELGIGTHSLSKSKPNEQRTAGVWLRGGCASHVRSGRRWRHFCLRNFTPGGSSWHPSACHPHPDTKPSHGAGRCDEWPPKKTVNIEIWRPPRRRAIFWDVLDEVSLTYLWITFIYVYFCVNLVVLRCFKMFFQCVHSWHHHILPVFFPCQEYLWIRWPTFFWAVALQFHRLHEKQLPHHRLLGPCLQGVDCCKWWKRPKSESWIWPRNSSTC